MGFFTQLLVHVEPIHVVNVAVALLSLVLAWLIGWTYGNIMTRPKKLLRRLEKQGIPGYPFRPFVGQLAEIMELRKKPDQDPAYAASTHAGQFFIDSFNKFGPFWTFCFGPFPRVAVADPALVRQALVTDNDSFDKNQFISRAIGILGNGLVTANGYSWTWQRRLINPAFSHKEIKRLYPTMLQCACEALAKLERAVKASPGEPINMEAAFSWLTLDVICRCAFGSQLETNFGPDLMKTLTKAFNEYLLSTSRVMRLSAFIPFLVYLPVKMVRTMWRSEKVIRGVMQQIISAGIAQHRQASTGTRQPEPVANGPDSAGNGLDADGKTDLLQLMMSATEGLGTKSSRDGGAPFSSYRSENDKKSDGKLAEKPLSDQLLMDNCLTFLFAGHETTALLLTWTTLLLSQHPEWQEKAREEVRALFAANGGATPSFDQLNELKICGWILNETLRLYPPAAALARTCNKDTKLSEALTVPKGCDIFIPIAAIHLRKDLWGDDAEAFRPDRFANGIGKASASPHAFMPFSMGPRTCIGQNFALAEAKIILALFLKKFSWKVDKSYVQYAEMVITTRPKFGMPVVLQALE